MVIWIPLQDTNLLVMSIYIYRHFIVSAFGICLMVLPYISLRIWHVYL